MEHSKKEIRNLGVLAFAPIVLFTLWLFYYFVILKDYIAQYQLEHHQEIVGLTATFYNPLFILLAINFTVAFVAFLYFVMNIWTREDVPSGQKIVWVVFMATFNIAAFPLYWYMHIKNDHVVRHNISPALS
jgi:hypothetical protein